VSINLIVGVGGRYENNDELGISHFLEHMAFKGTATRSARKIAEEFDNIGGRFNAYTSKERTVYYTKVLAQDTYNAIDIIADIIQNSTFDSEEIAKEYKVICQEIAQTQDDPEDLAHENLMQVVFPNQVLGESILGKSDTIAKFSAQSFRNYMAKHYTANRMVLSAAGDVNHHEFVAMAEDNFGNIPISSNVYACQSAVFHNGSMQVKKDLEQSVMYLGFEGCDYHDRRTFYHAQMLAMILGGGLSSRLFQEIREKQALAYSVGAFNMSLHDTGMFVLYAGTAHENVARTANSMINEASKICHYISEEELARAKKQVKVGITTADEGSSYMSKTIGMQYAMFKTYIPSEEILNIVDSTSVDDIVQISNRIFISTPNHKRCSGFSSIGNSTSDIDVDDLFSRLNFVN
jgi:predicted Zn-dependent peptidase